MKNYLKFLKFLFIIFLLVFVCYDVFKAFGLYNNIEIESIKLISYDETNHVLNIQVVKKNNIFNNNFKCYAKGYDIYTLVGNNNKCLFSLPDNGDYDIYLDNNLKTKSEVLKLSNSINNIISFKFQTNIAYLAVDEEFDLKFEDVFLDSEFNYDFKSTDENVAVIKDNKIVGVGKGETEVYSELVDDRIKIVVTDLITKPYATKSKKEVLPCEAFTEDEAALLDEILKNDVLNAGYGTRAGVVAAARFLTLKFKYRVPYFYENGRLHFSGVNFVDGEGRYYHEGLYLAKAKKESIKYTYRGPATWGCKLTNYEDYREYGFIPGKKMPNGLDCSGFVAWTLKNGGFDPGDVGAGDSPNKDYEMTDLGEMVQISNELLDSGKVKVGDLINFWGHIAVIIGWDDEHYYVAESLSYISGVRAMIYTKKELMKTFKYIILMDDFYKEDGNLTTMW